MIIYLNNTRTFVKLGGETLALPKKTLTRLIIENRPITLLHFFQFNFPIILTQKNIDKYSILKKLVPLYLLSVTKAAYKFFKINLFLYFFFLKMKKKIPKVLSNTFQCILKAFL